MHHLLQALLDQSPESIVMLDKNHKILIYNKKIKETLNSYFKKDIEVGQSYFPEFVVPENQTIYLQAFQEALQGKSTRVIKQTKNEWVNLWFEYIVTPLFDETENLEGIVLSAKDITKEKSLSVQLEESERRYRQTFETAPVSILVMNEQLQIKEMNQEAVDLFGYSKQELIGESVQLLIPTRFHHDHQNHSHQYLKDPHHIRMGYGRNTPAITKSKKEIVVDISLSTFQNAGKTFVTAIIQDITQKIENEFRIKLQFEKLTTIARNQSHHVRHSLSKIQGLISLTRLETPNLPTYFQDLEDSSAVLDQQIQEIVELIYKE